MTGNRDQAERGEDGGQSEEQRDARSHERSERHHEDEQRDRKREQTGLAEVVLVGGHHRVDLAGVAELADEERRVGLLQVVDGVEHRGDLVGGIVRVAADLELDESCVLVRGDLPGVAVIERRANVLNDLHLGDRRRRRLRPQP